MSAAGPKATTDWAFNPVWSDQNKCLVRKTAATGWQAGQRFDMNSDDSQDTIHIRSKACCL